MMKFEVPYIAGNFMTEQLLACQGGLHRITIFLIPFYLQAVQIHPANGVKLLEA
jgi:hypothetical protein